MADGDRAAGSSWQAKFGQTEGSGNGADAVGAGQEFTIPESAEAVGADVDVGGLSQTVLRQDLADHRRPLSTVPPEAVVAFPPLAPLAASQPLHIGITPFRTHVCHHGFTSFLVLS